MTTEEGNKLIAEFMGGKNYILKNYWPGLHEYEYESNENDLEFHEGWHWLMPVVEKIESMYVSNPMSVACSGFDQLTRMSLFSGIDEVWQAVVSFIQWYNEQPKS